MRLPALAALAAFTTASVAAADTSGNKWFTLPSTYKVFAHTGITGIPTGFSTTVRPRVHAAFDAWTGANVACTSWAVTDQGDFSSPTGIAAVNGNDSVNRVIWLGGANWRYSGGTLGLTTTSYYVGSGEIFDADMELNNDVTWSSTGSSSAFDYESIVLHEAGHFLGLNHTANGIAVMYASIAPGDIKRVLQSPDLTDVCSVYPSGGGTGGQGAACTVDANCTSPLKCRTSAGGTSKMCTVDCTSVPTCPTGLTCQTANIGKACLVPVGSPDLCAFCTQGSQCSTGMCVTDNGQHNWCTTSCASAASCGTGYDCLAGPSGGNICVPLSLCPNQCTSPSNCPLGYDCVSGMCEATGNPGDRCEASTFCQSCALCIGTATNATCRACCGGAGAGGTCTACAAAGCGTGQSCQAVGGTPDSVCVPVTGASVCQACGTGTPCAQGSCVGGRCHVACNPAAPGACTACYDLGSGNGLCACPDEVGLTGQACGPTGGGAFVACATGLACVAEGAVATCHTTCTLGVASSCAGGDVCQTLMGKAVCVKGTAAGTKCNACDAGVCGSGLSCFQNRCYDPCTLSAPSCATCVGTVAASAVCACSDQIASVNQTCGVVPPTDLYACGTGLTCIQAVCRAACVLSNPYNCAGGTVCRAGPGGNFCQPPLPVVDGGTDAGTSDAGKPDAGTDAGPFDAGPVADAGVDGGDGQDAGSSGAWPHLVAITPPTGSAASDTTVALMGDGFAWGVRGALGATTLSSVEFQTPGLLKAVVPKGLDPGVYDVAVVNPDGREARLPAAFTVTRDTSDVAGGCGCDGSGGAPGVAVLLLGVALAGARRRRASVLLRSKPH